MASLWATWPRGTELPLLSLVTGAALGAGVVLAGTGLVVASFSTKEPFFCRPYANNAQLQIACELDSLFRRGIQYKLPLQMSYAYNYASEERTTPWKKQNGPGELLLSRGNHQLT